MLVQMDCYKCILKQCTELAAESAAALPERNRMLRRYLTAVMDRLDDSTPPEVAEALFAIHRDVTGVDDPYAEIKLRSTDLALTLLPEFAAAVAESADPFLTALRIAIGGNVIDYGVNPDFQLDRAAELIREAAGMPLDMTAVGELRRRTAAARRVIYLLDNCGEAVFDRLLIDRIGADKVTLAVRGGAIINDVTRAELDRSGLGGLPVIDTGSRTPGVSRKSSSRKFLDALRRADVVIAKGQGNFESLYGDPEFANVFFLFRVKCPVLVRFAGVRLHSLQVKPNR
ncbi:MAG: ARMT1-like domain-containing protein [Lentisphaeria bacterium]|nr:ARMT1-like domain-containing protein [Lentisphaeria bacterium]